jgi:Domain of unknown function (DUF4157)
MQHTSQAHQPATSQPAAQREARLGSGSLSAQLAHSPRQAAQRRQLQDLRAGPVQRAEALEEEDEASATQLRADSAQRQDNRTGMPDGLKAGIESLSGMDMSDVRVHRNSSQPAQLNALAYAQGNDIHLSPGHHPQHEPVAQQQPATARVVPASRAAAAPPSTWADSPRQLQQGERLAQLQAAAAAPPPAAAHAAASAGQGGLPDGLRHGIESLSGMDMSGVRVHRNSGKPAQLNALAYAQGNDIHLGPGQEKHLPHEAWHVVQQRQGRVRATMQMAGVGVNDDRGLEREADVMGGRAGGMRTEGGKSQDLTPNSQRSVLQDIAQGVFTHESKDLEPPELANVKTRVRLYLPRLLDEFIGLSAAMVSKDLSNTEKVKEIAAKKRVGKVLKPIPNKYSLSRWLTTRISKRSGVEGYRRGAGRMISPLDETELAGGGHESERKIFKERLTESTEASPKTNTEDLIKSESKAKNRPQTPTKVDTQTNIKITEEHLSKVENKTEREINEEQQPKSFDVSPRAKTEDPIESKSETKNPPEISTLVDELKEKVKIKKALDIFDIIKDISEDIETALKKIDDYIEKLPKEGYEAISGEIKVKLTALKKEVPQYRNDLYEVLEGYFDIEEKDQKKLSDMYHNEWLGDNAALKEILKLKPQKQSQDTHNTKHNTRSTGESSTGMYDIARKSLRDLELMFTALSYNGSGFSAVGRAAEIRVKDEAEKDTTSSTAYSDFDAKRELHLVNEDLDEAKDANKNPFKKKDANDKQSSIDTLNNNHKNKKSTQFETFDKNNKVRAEYRGKGQVSNMNGVSANLYAYSVLGDDAAKSKWEWLHIRAASLGGSTAPENLVLGTYDCNTYMMPFEANIVHAHNLLLEQQKDFKLWVNWEIKDPFDDKHSHAYKKITMSWHIIGKEKDQQKITFSPLALEAPPISKVEIRRLQHLLKEYREAMTEKSPARKPTENAATKDSPKPKSKLINSHSMEQE